MRLLTWLVLVVPLAIHIGEGHSGEGHSTAKPSVSSPTEKHDEKIRKEFLALRERLGSAEFQDQQQAAEQIDKLGRAHPKTVGAILIERLGHSDPHVYAPTGTTLAELGVACPKEILPLLIDEIQNRKEEDQCRALCERLLHQILDELRCKQQEEQEAEKPQSEKNEIKAIKALYLCKQAATLYKKLRMLDANGNGVGEFPSANDEKSWSVLRDPQGNSLVTDSLAKNGVSEGYRFRITADPKDPEFACYIAAVPIHPGVTGRKAFCAEVSTETVYQSASGAPPPDTWDVRKGPGSDFQPCPE